MAGGSNTHSGGSGSSNTIQVWSLQLANPESEEQESLKKAFGKFGTGTDGRRALSKSLVIELPAYFGQVKNFHLKRSFNKHEPVMLQRGENTSAY